MPVLRSQRTYPLVLKADPLNTGIVAAFDFAAEDDSTTLANGKDHSGNNRHYVPFSGTLTPLVVATAAGKGRDTSMGRTSAGAYYDAAGAISVGMDRGTGDFSIFKRIRTPTSAPASTTIRNISRFTDGGGNKIQICLYEVLATAAWHWQVIFDATSIFLWNDTGNPAMPPSTDSILHITRTAGVVKFFVNGVLKKTVSGNTTNLLSTTGASHTVVGNYTAGQTGVDAVFLDDIYWSRALTDSEVAAHAANPYNYYENSVGADSITTTSPASGATVGGASFAVTGTYAGATTVTSVEASFNGGGYQTISASPTGGTFTGNMTGQTAGNGTLTVRTKNGSTVVATSTVTNVTVNTDAIAFAAEDDTIPARASAYKMFQRDGNNQASVRIIGTYSGAPTGIQYSWKGGAWATLVASPAGGTFDQTVTLQGPGQGDLSIRFTNSTGIAATIPYVGVGDVYVVAGQSNHVGKSTVYVQPVAPSANPSWRSVKRAKNGAWALHVEDAANKFDDAAGATYSVHADLTPGGSYFGALATKIMACGVPVAFVPVAMGSTSLAGWTINTATTSLYGAALAVAAKLPGYRAVLWWLGETDTQGSSTQAAYVAALNLLPNDWFTRTGKKWFIWAINAAGNSANFQPIHDALIQVGQTNANVLGYADMDGAFTGDVHYDTTGEINELANRAFVPLAANFYSLAGTGTSQSNQSGTGTVSGAGGLFGSPTSQANQSGTGAVASSGTLAGAPCSQGNQSGTGTVGSAGVLNGSPCSQANQVSVGAVGTAGSLSGAPCSQSNASPPGAIGSPRVGVPCSQANAASTGSISESNPNFVLSVARKLVVRDDATSEPPKHRVAAGSRLDFSFDWGAYLAAIDDAIQSCEITTPAGLNVFSYTRAGDVMIAMVDAVIPGYTHSIFCQITTAQGRIDSRTIIVEIVPAR